MENFILFLSVFTGIFGILVVFIEKSDKLKSIILALVASFIASCLYFVGLQIYSTILYKKLEGTWEDTLKADTISFHDGKLDDLHGSKQIVLFNKTYHAFKIEFGEGEFYHLIMYKTPEGTPDIFPVKLKEDSLQIRTYTFSKIEQK